jgi:outer membrane protein
VTRRRWSAAAALGAALVGSPAASRAAEAPLDADACVAVALRQSGTVAEADAKTAEWAARLEEVSAMYAPRLEAILLAAPMYGMHGSGFDPKWRRDLTEWGPYLHLQATLAKPLYTFGRLEAGETAARERTAVEAARAAQVKNAVAFEVRRFYFLHLYARSLAPTLSQAQSLIDEARVQAQREFDDATGRVTMVDLSKLRYAATELEKARLQREMGEGLALAALKHTMGLADDAALALADATLPPAPDAPVAPLATLVLGATEHRPEHAALSHGRLAAAAFGESLSLADAPVFFLAGQVTADYAPTRDHDDNPWHSDPYNNFVGGLALGLKFDIDYWGNAARSHGVDAQLAQVAGLAQLARTGIPLEVRKARDTLVQAQAMYAASVEGANATKKWMLFAATAYAAGTGEPRDLLEGVGAFVQARKAQYESLLGVHTANAELRQVTGAP